MRTPQEIEEVCRIYNLELEVGRRYVQFGDLFNLLHAGVSFLRTWQNGFGVVGVLSKHSARSLARYPVLWGLDKIGSLSYPDPTDKEDSFSKDWAFPNDALAVDRDFEAERRDLKSQTQDWAQLEKNPEAELFVFIGRWSMEKGIDLVADVFPAILESHLNAQLICVGPIVDLYGKFAALKLERLANLCPGRVCSRPETSVVPPCVLGGADFALILSRDEPFGLVAVEFGRKGALSIGARVGGLGNMPGWWFTIESTSPKHINSQFKMAIEAALATELETRAIMRTYATRQRFPVTQWRAKIAVLHNTAITLSQRKTLCMAARKQKSLVPPRLFFPRGRCRVSSQTPPGTPLSVASTRVASPSGVSVIERNALSISLETESSHRGIAVELKCYCPREDHGACRSKYFPRYDESKFASHNLISERPDSWLQFYVS